MGNCINIPMTKDRLQKMYKAFCRTGSGGSFTFSENSPSSPEVQDYWWNSNLDVLYKYVEDGGSQFWIQISI